MTLSQIIADIRSHILNGGIYSTHAQASIQSLGNLGYKYNNETFPTLRDTQHFKNHNSDYPTNLSEALLWKLGKWKSYKKFSPQYETSTPAPSTTDVVFYAFARHLSDPTNPIYDQHTLRAMWAVNPNLDDNEILIIRKTLINTNEQWKQTMSGKYTVDCYELYCKHLGEISQDGASLREIDLLLMPLGQALKKSSKSLADFILLTNAKGS